MLVNKVITNALVITRKCPLSGHCRAPPGRPGGLKSQEVTHTKKLLLVTFYDMTTGIGSETVLDDAGGRIDRNKC